MTAYLKLALAALLVLAGYLAGHHEASAAGELKLAKVSEQNAQNARDVSNLIAQREADARKQEQDMAAAVAAVDATYTQRMADAKATADRTIADLRAGTLKLRDEWSCTPVLATRVSAQATGNPGAVDANAELRRQGASDLVRGADEADATINALQEILRKERGG